MITLLSNKVSKSGSQEIGKGKSYYIQGGQSQVSQLVQYYQIDEIYLTLNPKL